MKTILLVFACAAVLLARPPVEENLPEPIQEKVLGGALCSVCKDLIKEAEALGEGYAEDWLKDEIAVICDPLGFLAKECKKEFNKILDKINGYINSKLSPEKACKEIKFC